VNDAIDKILESKSVSCLIVAHRLSTIARAEKVAVLEDGRIVEFGLYRELAFKESSKFRELMGAQLNAARI
jgi:ABC-type multidrug transport system fused ATPase/permease subunit